MLMKARLLTVRRWWVARVFLFLDDQVGYGSMLQMSGAGRVGVTTVQRANAYVQQSMPDQEVEEAGWWSSSYINLHACIDVGYQYVDVEFDYWN
jgi:hypothetical protein